MNKIESMTENDEKLMQELRESCFRYLQYVENMNNMNAIKNNPNPESDWQPLHIRFRFDDE